MSLNPQLTDGDFGATNEVEGRVTEYPFLQAPIPDRFAQLHKRPFQVDRASYAPALATRTSYTNLLTFSEDFSNAAWTKSEVTRTGAARANPWDGQATFSKFLETVTNTEHYIFHSFTFTAVAHTVTALLAPGLSRTYARLLANDGTNAYQAIYNLVDGTVKSTAGTGATASIRRYSDGSCRCSITFTPLGAAGFTTVNSIADDGTTFSYVGDVTKGFYCGGVQIQAAASTGPYIVTTAASRTISAPDVDGIVNSANADPDDFAFLVTESAPQGIGCDIIALIRAYARLPAPQTVYGSRVITRPVMHDVHSGGWYAASFDNGVTSHIFNSRTAATFSVGVYAAPIYKVSQVGHGRSVGDLAVAWSGDRIIASGPIIEVIDADNYYLSFDVKNPASGYANGAAEALMRTVNGSTSGPVSAKELTSFYLPGFTVGIAVPSDIPVIATKLAAADWLGQIFAYIGGGSLSTYFATVDGTPLARWMDGPIYQQTTISAQMSDALETVGVTA